MKKSAWTLGLMLLAAAVMVPLLVNAPVEAAPPTMQPGVPDAPGGHLPECPWLATIEIIDCVTGEVIGWRTKSVGSAGQCSAGIQDLIQSATQVHNECVGDTWCREYKWCED